MIPYQFYMVKSFPEFESGRPITNQVQMTITGLPEQVKTDVSPGNGRPIGTFERIMVKTGVRHEVFGYTNFIVEGRIERREFTEYVQGVEFPAYLDRDRKALFMRASHRVARGFLSNIRRGGTGIELLDVEIDFAKVNELYSRCLGAWFSNPSPRVKSAGIVGDQLQNDVLYKNLQKAGKMSSFSMEFPYEHTFHPIILGKRGAVVLVKNYKKFRTMEPHLIHAIFDELVSKTWTEKKSRKDLCKPPTIIDPDYDG